MIFIMPKMIDHNRKAFQEQAVLKVTSAQFEIQWRFAESEKPLDGERPRVPQW